ncbi:MAG: ATP-binding protein [Gammaproteobacteria bacterium]|nr:ATP-binding protein [Gammaproteobacteria bacterium]
MTRYFPQGVVTGDYFCNRENERQILKKSIESHEHIVLVAPRRYGKTSLTEQVLSENNFPGVSMDFFFALSQEEVCKTMIEGVSKIITSLLPKTKTLCNKLIDSIRTFNPKISFTLLGQKLEISTKQTTEKSISELLLALDHFAGQAQKSCVVVFDEFQQIGQLKENHAVEAAIRHAVERSLHVSYIFCGSNRHMLNEMFSDKSRPLYHLCDLMTINRISQEDYFAFLNKMSRRKWKKLLSRDVIDEIIHLTERHPYYLNALCRRLWRNNDTPTITDVRNTWDTYVTQQGVWISNDLSHLTLNRRKVLTALAYQPSNEPQGHHFSKRVGLNPSGVQKCLIDLSKLDMIYTDHNSYYHVLDPVVAYFIRQHSLNMTF